MEEDYLKRELDLLWEKVQGELKTKGPGALSRRQLSEGSGFASAFESAQAEIQAESLQLLRSRFEKEKSYWENLIAAKDETIARLQNEIQNEQKKSEELKLKIQELQSNQTQLFHQSFSTLDLQRRSLNLHMEQLEKELQDAHKEILTLSLNLKEEKELQEKTKSAWEEKEKKWMEERDQRELEIEQIKKDLFQRRQTELEEIAGLEETIQSLKNELQENKTLFETKTSGSQNLLQEKENQVEKIQQELDQVKSQLEKEREERRLASIERERQSAQAGEDKKRLVEQLLFRENKIKELQESLERMMKERADQEASFRKRDEALLLQEESLRKRREEWVESIKSQSGQQLNISGRVVELLNNLELKLGIKTSAPAATIAAPPLPVILKKDSQKSGEPPSSFSALLEKTGSKYARFGNLVRFLKRRKGAALLAVGLALFTITAVLLFLEGGGRRAARAQKYLAEGNQQFTKGEMEKAAQSLEKAYQLDPENSMIKNSLTLVLGEIANKEFREGQLDAALKKTEFLYKILPEDPDVVQLHNSILQALGRQVPAQKSGEEQNKNPR